MLIMTEAGPRIVPDGPVPDGAVPVRKLKFLKEVRFASPSGTGRFNVGDTATVGGEVPETVAYNLLDPADMASRHNANPRVEIVAEPAAKPEEKSQ